MQWKKIKLGERLETVKSFLSDIPENGCIADIGSDHGKLVCAYLEECGKNYAIATDVSVASLRKARALVEERCLSDRVSFREGNGLSVITPNEVNAVCFCGMGGEVIRDCLINEFMNPDILFVFQPMRGIEELRQFLYKNRFHVVKDVMVKENGKYYQVFSGRFGRDKEVIPDTFPESFWSIGYKAFQSRDIGTREYIAERIPELKLQALSAGQTPGGKIIGEKLRGFLQVQQNLEN